MYHPRLANTFGPLCATDNHRAQVGRWGLLRVSWIRSGPPRSLPCKQCAGVRHRGSSAP